MSQEIDYENIIRGKLTKDLYNDEQIDEWLKSPSPLLNQQIPNDMIKNGLGLLVLTAVNKLTDFNYL